MWVIACLALAACAAPAGTAAQAVTNGSDDAGDPAVVALVVDQGNVGCTASVIEAHTVLTAAHCLGAVEPRKIRVWFGGDVYSQVTGGTDPMFDATTFANDVAVLTFFDAAGVPPLVRETAAPVVGDVIRVVGFGTTSAMASDSTTKRAGSATISDVQALAFTVMPAPSQPCHGDSGGPAITAAGTVGGVVSNGDGGCSDHAVYARVDAAAAFIESISGRHGAGDGERRAGVSVRRAVRRWAVPGGERRPASSRSAARVHARQRLPRRDDVRRRRVPVSRALARRARRCVHERSRLHERHMPRRTVHAQLRRAAACPAGFTCGGRARATATWRAAGARMLERRWAGDLIALLVLARARRSRRCA